MRWIWLATMFLHTGCFWIGAALVANGSDKPTDALRSWPIGQPSPPAKGADIVGASSAELEADGYVMAAIVYFDTDESGHAGGHAQKRIAREAAAKGGERVQIVHRATVTTPGPARHVIVALAWRRGEPAPPAWRCDAGDRDRCFDLAASRLQTDAEKREVYVAACGEGVRRACDALAPPLFQ